MAAVFPAIAVVACRACGATRAAPGENGVCATCWKSYRRSCIDNQDTEVTFNEWLAHKLMNDLNRLKKHGITGRCEAVSKWIYGHPGYQCARQAIATREGRRVCTIHSDVSLDETLFFVGERCDQYVALAEIVHDLAQVDDKFADAIREAIVLLDHPEKIPA